MAGASMPLSLLFAGGRRRRPASVIGLRNARKLLDERRDRPEFLVLCSGKEEARHAGHVDAVLDHPEQLRDRAVAGQFAAVKETIIGFARRPRVGAIVFQSLGLAAAIR